jgi:X-linked retinitis pigmentosa GTPase regulator
MESFTEVFAWGSDEKGQLGLGGSIGKNYCLPRMCSFNVLIREVSCGEEHAGFISSLGHVYTMGSNGEGRLGIDDRTVLHSSSPCLVSHLSGLNPLKIACGWGHSAVVTSNGWVYAWGVGEFGALGLGTNTSQWKPQKVELPEGFEAIEVSCGSRHTGILGRNGKLAMVGCGEVGQLGTKKREKESTPVLIDAENVKHISCGIFHTAYLDYNGTVYTMGGNSFGQLGTGSKKSTSTPEKLKTLEGVFITQIACGHHSAAICENGELYVWGTSSFGEYLVPTKVFFEAKVKDISIGNTFSVVALENMTLYTWGTNSNGELGLSDYEQRKNPCSIELLKGKYIKKLSCGGSFCLVLGNNIKKRPSHTRSQSKAEYTHKASIKKDTVYDLKSDTFDSSLSKLEYIRLQDIINEEINKNIRLKNELDEVYTQLNESKSEYIRIDRLQHLNELEISKLQEENKTLNQKILSLSQEHQFINKNTLNENKSLREEIHKFKWTIETLKQSYAAEIAQITSQASADRETFAKNLENESNKLKIETQNKIRLETSYKSLSEENNKLIKQIQDFYVDMSNLEKQLKYSKEQEMLQQKHEKEGLNHQIKEKQTEYENLSILYHDLNIEYNKLSEENKIYKQSIIELELKNTKLFENFEKDLKVRAQDYRNRTLSILSAPYDRETRRSISPISPYLKKPLKEVQNRKALSETTQTKLGNTAARLLEKMENESALTNIRISSPSRKSPERPVPYRFSQPCKDIKKIFKSKILEHKD